MFSTVLSEVGVHDIVHVCSHSVICVDLRLLVDAATAAGKPREAIDMYLHNHDWDAAMRVAEQYDPTAIMDILTAQATAAAEANQYQLAESLYLKAKRPEAALAMFREAGQWQSALRLAEAYLPAKIQVWNYYISSTLH